MVSLLELPSEILGNILLHTWLPNSLGSASSAQALALHDVQKAMRSVGLLAQTCARFWKSGAVPLRALHTLAVYCGLGGVFLRPVPLVSTTFPKYASGLNTTGFALGALFCFAFQGTRCVCCFRRDAHTQQVLYPAHFVAMVRQAKEVYSITLCDDCHKLPFYTQLDTRTAMVTYDISRNVLLSSGVPFVRDTTRPGTPHLFCRMDLIRMARRMHGTADLVLLRQRREFKAQLRKDRAEKRKALVALRLKWLDEQGATGGNTFAQRAREVCLRYRVGSTTKNPLPPQLRKKLLPLIARARAMAAFHEKHVHDRSKLWYLAAHRYAEARVDEAGELTSIVEEHVAAYMQFVDQLCVDFVSIGLPRRVWYRAIVHQLGVESVLERACDHKVHCDTQCADTSADGRDDLHAKIAALESHGDIDVLRQSFHHLVSRWLRIHDACLPRARGSVAAETCVCGTPLGPLSSCPRGMCGPCCRLKVATCAALSLSACT